LDRRLNLIRNIWNSTNSRIDNKSMFSLKEEAKSFKHHNYFTLNTSKLHSQITKLIRNKSPIAKFESNNSLRIIKSNSNKHHSTNYRLINIFKNIVLNDASNDCCYAKNLKLFNKLEHKRNTNIQNDNNYNSINYLDLNLMNRHYVHKTKSINNARNKLQFKQNSSSLPQVSDELLFDYNDFLFFFINIRIFIYFRI
jgi:hypothetical protein